MQKQKENWIMVSNLWYDDVKVDVEGFWDSEQELAEFVTEKTQSVKRDVVVRQIVWQVDNLEMSKFILVVGRF